MVNPKCDCLGVSFLAYKLAIKVVRMRAIAIFYMVMSNAPKIICKETYLYQGSFGKFYGILLIKFGGSLKIHKAPLDFLV